ncbi:MAG TPA: response regulator, partial [Planctomycetaceae bacterium]|nr:response regulator [Planctomycetaceae bacterium]
ELMKGRIEFESEFGVGTLFTVRIPVDASAGSTAGPVVTRSTKSVRAVSRETTILAGETPARIDRGKSRKILVVDDDANVREMMSRYLSDHGFEVITAGDGVSALRLVRRENPDLITLDVVMPELDGWTVLAALKADEQTASIPVVMTTTVDNEEKGFALGADDYLLKPIVWSHLQRVLDRHCGGTARTSVLVVDDDAETRRLLRRQLEQDGWSVREAEHGQAALELMEQDPPGLLLLDLMMPVMNGFEFLIVREENPQWKKIPVIVLTARDPGSAELEHLQGSVARVLQKGTYTCSELLEEIHRRLGDPAPAGSGGSERS